MYSRIRYALRSLRRAPGFTLAAIFTLALGIGATTTIFSVVDAILLRPLPYPQSERLVMVWDRLAKYNLPRRSPEYHTAAAYRRLTGIFESSGGIYWFDDWLKISSGSERVSVMTVSREVFPMLQPGAEAGRLFIDEEYKAGAERVIVLGHSLFMRRFGGDRGVIGTSVEVAGHSRRVVGVMAADFGFNLRAGQVDIWAPASLETPRSWGNATRMIARLKPGVSLGQAQAALDVAARHVDAAEHPYAGPNGEDAGYSAVVLTLHQTLLDEYRTVALVLLAAAGAVLLIACVNVANLLLVRAVLRERETTIRYALGASRSHMFRQWAAESAVLVAAGGALGILIAFWTVKAMLYLSPAALPGAVRIGVDLRALAFTWTVAALACLLFGMAPVLFAGAQLSARSTPHRRRAASVLVTAEVALAVMLLAGAALLLRSFSRLTAVDPGFDPSRLLTFNVDFNRGTLPPERVRVYSELREKLAATLGVAAATIGLLPLRGGGVNAGAGDPFGLRGQSYDSASGPVTQFANLTFVGLDYFRTLRIPLRQGRDFGPADITGGPARNVIVNQTLARNFFPRGAIGETIGVPPPCASTKCDFEWMTIVGVAADVKTTTLDSAAKPQIYLPQPAGGSFAVRTSTTGANLEHAIPAIVQSIDPGLTAYGFKSMEDRLSATVAQPRFQALVVALFGLTALLLASVGVFGVVAHATAQRTRELGIRIALGANHLRLLQIVFVGGMAPVSYTHLDVYKRQPVF